MSRGLGKLQRTLLEILDQRARPLDALELAAAAFGCRPDAEGFITISPAQLVSTRRALRRLADAHHIADLGRRDGRQRWASATVGRRLLGRTVRALARRDEARG